jgi:hypothetical protein
MVARSAQTEAGLLIVGEDSQRKNNTQFVLHYFVLDLAAWGREVKRNEIHQRGCPIKKWFPLSFPCRDSRDLRKMS